MMSPQLHRCTLTAASRRTSPCPQVSELRGLFDAYLEQMQGMAGSGPEVEALMIRALEAVDMLDGALALHKVGGDAHGSAGCVLAGGEEDRSKAAWHCLRGCRPYPRSHAHRVGCRPAHWKTRWPLLDVVLAVYVSKGWR